jgi:hypothetical protein
LIFHIFGELIHKFKVSCHQILPLVATV